MATTNVIKMQILFRRDTAANWELHKDIVPAAGEPCFIIDKNILKIGDGKTTFENLEPINGAKFEIAADGKSIVLDDNVLKLMGFDSAEVGAQPRKNAEGFIEWVVPAADENMDRLLIEVDTLRIDVDNLQEDVAGLKEIVEPSGEGTTSLLDRLESLENKIDGVGDDSIDKKIDAKINEFAIKVSDDGVVNTIKELVDYVADHGPKAADMATDILTLQQLVGDTPVNEQILSIVGASGHIKGIRVNGNLLNAIDGIVDISIAEQTLGVKGSDEIDVAEDGTLTIKQISFNKIVQAEDTLIVMDGGNAV